MTNPTKPGDPADRAADGAFGGVTSHRAGYGDKLARVEAWLRKYPSATLASGEGAALLAEIDRLRAAIDRVRAEHQPETRTTRMGTVWYQCTRCRLQHPCPTLRKASAWLDAALDGDDA